MPVIKLGRLTFFKILTYIQVISALIVLMNEVMAINHKVPGGNFPIEHQFSWTRVILFCSSAVICFLATWVFNAKKELIRFLPSFQSTFLIAAFPILAGLGLSHYYSPIGWCCEPYYAFQFGFPFSFLLGLSEFGPSIKQFAGYSIFEVLTQSQLITYWEFLFHKFFLNSLFWSSIVFVFPNLAALLFPKGKIQDRRDFPLSSS